MALSVLTNVESLSAQGSLSRTQRSLSATMGRLSTGLRINTAGDDAAGLAISEKLRSQVRSMAQAERNANDGTSLLQVAEGALNEVSGIMTRLRELAIQSANGTLGATERTFINNEFVALRSELDRIAEVTEFNGQKLLDSGGVTLDFQVGIRGTVDDRISVTIASAHSVDMGVVGATNLSTVDVTTAANAQAALANIDQAITDVSSRRGTLGAAQNRLAVTISNLQSAREGLSAAESRIRDADIAAETAAMTRGQILMQAGVSVLSQANQLPALALSLLGG